MQINGGVRFCEQGMKASIRAMHVQSEILGMINDNVAGFDKVGFQRREPVVSSFTEYIGVHGLSTVDWVDFDNKYYRHDIGKAIDEA